VRWALFSGQLPPFGDQPKKEGRGKKIKRKKGKRKK